MQTKELIFNMLTEGTGTHFLDSGGDSGRHWQRNANKSMQDFEDEPEETIEKHGEYYYRTLSVYHYLKELELDNICNEFNEINKNCKDWNAETEENEPFIYGVSKEAWQFLKYPSYHTKVDLMLAEPNFRECKIERTFNTYNGESDLSQVLQGTHLTINTLDNSEYDNQYLLLQIHQGADVRGGYTDAKLFKLNEDGLIHSYLYECSEQEELEQLYKEQEANKQLQLN